MRKPFLPSYTKLIHAPIRIMASISYFVWADVHAIQNLQGLIYWIPTNLAFRYTS